MAAVEPLEAPARRRHAPQSPAALAALLAQLAEEPAAIVSGMVQTGMGPGEYWGRWELQYDRVRIHGTKRAGRDRFVPLIGLWPIRQPAISYRAFREALADASDRAATPYDLRRTFAHWMEEAGVPRTRRRLYMGHGARDVLDLDELVDVQTFLEADAQKVREFLEASHGFSRSQDEAAPTRCRMRPPTTRYPTVLRLHAP